MRATCIRLGVVFAVVLSVSVAAARDPSCVGDYGDPERLVIDGCKTFSVEELKEALTVDLGTLLAAHPAAPLDSYCHTLRDKITAGYLHVGFPDVRVDVRVDRESKKIRIHIEEGRRYVAGEIIAKGNHHVPASTIIKWLSESYPPADARFDGMIVKDGKEVPRWVDKEGRTVRLEDPVWAMGTPATFDKFMIETIKARTKRALSDLGYFFSVFQVSVVPQKDGKHASLTIEFFAEGTKAVLGVTNITGNKNNSPEEIADHLKLEPGKPFNAAKLTIWQERLWRSGRFIKSDVSVSPPPIGSDQVKLDIVLVESSWAPRLSKPLSREQTILLKLRDRLANPERWDGDLCAVAQGSEGVIEFVVSPSHGMLGRFHSKTWPNSASPKPVEATVVLSDTFSGILCPTPLREKLWIDMIDYPAVRFYGSLDLLLNDDPDSSDMPQKVIIGYGARSYQEGENLPLFEFSINMSPAWCVALPNIRDDTECKIEDGILSIKCAEEAYRIDVRDVRFFDYTRFEEGKITSTVTVRLQPDAFKKRLADIQSASVDCPNIFNAVTPFESILAFICNENFPASFAENPKARRWLRFARKMHEKNAFLPRGGLSEILDQWIYFKPDIEGEFAVPTFIPEGMGSSELSKNDFFLQRGLVFVDHAFPRQSWPWIFSREIMFVASGRAPYARSELQNLLTSNSNGPIFYLVSACTFERFSPQHARLFAIEGLGRLSTVDFQKDCLVLLDKNCVIGQYTQQIARAVRKLTPEEVVELVGKPSSNDKSLLSECVEALRSQPDRPAEDVLLEVLTNAWKAGLREQFKTKLSEICDAIGAAT